MKTELKAELKTVSEDYLKNKLAELENNKLKVDSLLKTYIELSKKIEGAIEILNAMLEDLNKPKEDNDNKV